MSSVRSFLYIYFFLLLPSRTRWPLYFLNNSYKLMFNFLYFSFSLYTLLPINLSPFVYSLASYFFPKFDNNSNVLNMHCNVYFYFFSFHFAAIKLVQPSLLVFSIMFGLIFYYYYYYFNLVFLNWYLFCISFFHCKISWEDFIGTIFIYLNLSKILYV